MFGVVANSSTNGHNVDVWATYYYDAGRHNERQDMYVRVDDSTSINIQNFMIGDKHMGYTYMPSTKTCHSTSYTFQKYCVQELHTSSVNITYARTVNIGGTSTVDVWEIQTQNMMGSGFASISRDRCISVAYSAFMVGATEFFDFYNVNISEVPPAMWTLPSECSSATPLEENEFLQSLAFTGALRHNQHF